MQSLTAAPRAHLTAAQVTALLTGPSVEVDQGVEVLDNEDAFIEDASDDLLGGEVEYQAGGLTQRTCQLLLTREFDWQEVRFRPYMTLTDPASGLSARFNLGVFLPQTPERVLGTSNSIFDVRGDDKVSLLLREVGDSYTVDAGTPYLTAVTDAILDADAGTNVLLSSEATGIDLASPMVWALHDSPDLWVEVINTILAAVGYGPIWADENGSFRARPLRDPAERATEWTFTLDDPTTNLVAEDRTYSRNIAEGFNYWRIIAKDYPTAPVEGDGMVTIDDSEGYEREVRRVIWVEAADQASLVAQAEDIVRADQRLTETLQLTTGPLPISGHLDVVRYIDPDLGPSLRAIAQSWSLPLTGEDQTWTLEVIR